MNNQPMRSAAESASKIIWSIRDETTATPRKATYAVIVGSAIRGLESMSVGDTESIGTVSIEEVYKKMYAALSSITDEQNKSTNIVRSEYCRVDGVVVDILYCESATSDCFFERFSIGVNALDIIDEIDYGEEIISLVVMWASEADKRF